MKRSLLSVILFFLGSAHLPAQLFWNTNGTGSTLTAANWGTSSSGPFTTAWTNSSDINFTSNSAITYVTTIPVGNLTITGSSTVTLTPAGTFSTGGNVRTFDIGSGSTLVWGGQNVSTTAGTGFIKNGAGTWNIGVISNAYTGPFTLNAGTVVVGGNNSLGTGTMTINGGTIAPSSSSARDYSAKFTSLTIGGSFQLGDAVNVSAGTGSLTFGAASLGSSVRTITIGSTGTYTFGILSGTGGGLTVSSNSTGNITLGGANTYTGATTINSGTLKLTGSGSIAASSGLSNAGTFDISGTTAGTTISTLSGAGITTLGTRTLTLSNASGSFSGAIGGSGGLTLTAGTETLTGSNNYTGATTINGGTLRLNGSLTSAVSVNSGGTFGGTGSTTGSLTVNSGGILAPGNSIGTLSVNSFTWNGGGLLNFELGTGNSSDRLAITGALTKGSGSGFSFNFLNTGTTGNTYTLITSPTISSSFLSSDFSYTNLASGLSGTFAFNGNNLEFSVSAIPEPSTYAAIFGTLALVGTVWHRRKHRKVS